LLWHFGARLFGGNYALNFHYADDCAVLAATMQSYRAGYAETPRAVFYAFFAARDLRGKRLSN
jgi:hypothetical protein